MSFVSFYLFVPRGMRLFPGDMVQEKMTFSSLEECLSDPHTPEEGTVVTVHLYCQRQDGWSRVSAVLDIGGDPKMYEVARTWVRDGGLTHRVEARKSASFNSERHAEYLAGKHIKPFELNLPHPLHWHLG